MLFPDDDLTGLVPGRINVSKPKITGKKYFTNGVITVKAFECPDGFVPGIDAARNEKISRTKTGKKLSEYHRRRTSEGKKGKKGIDNNSGKHWYTNGVKTVLTKSCPDGYYPGRIL